MYSSKLLLSLFLPGALSIQYILIFTMYGNLVSLGGTNGKALEEEMAAHSSILAWKIQSMGWQRVRHNLATTQW